MLEYKETSQESKSFFEILNDIVRLCIDNAANIEPGADISIRWSPDGKRHTTIGAATIRSGATVEELAIIEDGAKIGNSCEIGFRAKLEVGAEMGYRSTIKTGSTLGKDAFVRPGVTIGNFSYIAGGSEVIGDIGNNTSVLLPCIAGNISHHGTVKRM